MAAISTHRARLKRALGLAHGAAMTDAIVIEAPVERHPLDDAALRAGLDALARLDPDVGAALEERGYPAARTRTAGFATLLRILTAQQLSTRSAAAIWARLEVALAGRLDAAGFLALDEAALRGVGLSRQKMTYGRALADAIAAGQLDLAALADLPEDDAIAAISAVKGFGRWSAEIYLLFALGRADVLPADDLALQIGMQRLKRLSARPTGRELRALAEPWRPYRGCGAILLWHVYGAATLEERRAR